MTQEEFDRISKTFREKEVLEDLLSGLDRYGYAYVIPGKKSNEAVQITGDILNTIKKAVQVRLNYLKLKAEQL